MSSGVESVSTGSRAMRPRLNPIDDDEVTIAVNVRRPAGVTGVHDRADRGANPLRPARAARTVDA